MTWDESKHPRGKGGRWTFLSAGHPLVDALKDVESAKASSNRQELATASRRVLHHIENTKSDELARLHPDHHKLAGSALRNTRADIGGAVPSHHTERVRKARQKLLAALGKDHL